MAEKRHLLRSESSDEKRTGYGSIPYRGLHQNDDEVIPIKFLYRKRDCVVVSVLFVLVSVAIITTLAIGLPLIRAKNDAYMDDLRRANESSVVLSSATAGQLKMAAGGVGGSTRQLPPVPVNFPNPSTSGVYAEAAVVTNCPECSAIASNILEEGGSAMDAAIAATICVSVADPHHTGLGGGFLMTLYNRKNGTAQVIDARETAPALAHENMFEGDEDLSSKGGLSVAVPGLVPGLWQAHKMYGRMEWSSLIEPSIRLCRDGFTVRSSLADALQDQREAIYKDPGLRSVFTDGVTGELLKRGDIVRQPALGRTLYRLAQVGGTDFTTGLSASQLVADIQEFGGIVSSDDFANYEVKIREPITVDLTENWKLVTVPPPGSGAIVAFFLNIMSGYETTASEDDITNYHRIAEAFKHAYARRASFGDMDFVDMTELVGNMTSKAYAEAVRRRIVDDRTFPAKYYGNTAFQISDHGTSHVSVVAPNGDAVVVTSTINQRFGAQILSPSTGVILNDEMDDFSSPNITNFFEVPPSLNNYIVPGKRPFSSMCPSLIIDSEGGAVLLATGASGGTRITSATAYVALRHLWMKEDLQTATDAFRIHHQLYPDELETEIGMPLEIIKGLAAIGHNIELVKKASSSVNSVSYIGGGHLNGVGDRRVGGGPAGF